MASPRHLGSPRIVWALRMGAKPSDSFQFRTASAVLNSADESHGRLVRRRELLYEQLPRDGLPSPHLPGMLTQRRPKRTEAPSTEALSTEQLCILRPVHQDLGHVPHFLYI